MLLDSSFNSDTAVRAKRSHSDFSNISELRFRKSPGSAKLPICRDPSGR
jgi:hypothetical protein